MGTSASVVERCVTEATVHWWVYAKAVLADTTEEVVAGDSMRSLAGREYAFTALDDSVFIQTAVPKPV